MMVMPGWCCCSYWEQWDSWTPDDYAIAGESLRDQLRRLRNYRQRLRLSLRQRRIAHPAAEQVYLKVFAEENWPHPYISSATDRNTPGAGPHRRQDDRPVRIRRAQLLAASTRSAAAHRASSPRPAPAPPSR